VWLKWQSTYPASARPWVQTLYEGKKQRKKRDSQISRYSNCTSKHIERERERERFAGRRAGCPARAAWAELCAPCDRSLTPTAGLLECLKRSLPGFGGMSTLISRLNSSICVTGVLPRLQKISLIHCYKSISHVDQKPFSRIQHQLNPQ
jgi:hypothetical protein